MKIGGCYFYCIATVINFQEKSKIFTEDLREIHVFLINFMYTEENKTSKKRKERIFMYERF